MAARDGSLHDIGHGSRMMPTDALFWYAEEATPELRPLVGGLLMLDRLPDRQRLRALVERWIVRIPRLHQRVVEAPLALALPEWEDDPHFELDYHVRDVTLPEPATDEHLFEFISAVFATPLDHLRPLWEGYLVEGLEGNRAACFFKVHHSVMDGVGSMAGFDALTQGHRAEPVRVPRRPPQGPPRGTAGQFTQLGGEALRNAVAAMAAVVGVAGRALIHPAEVVDDVARTLRGLRGMLTDLTAPASHDPLADASTGIGRRLDGMTLSLSRLRRVKDVLGITLNDLVLTAVSGAVGRYHDHRGVHVDELHCMVPMNLRQEQERTALGNRVGMINIALPVGEPDPLARLERISRQTHAAKSDRRGAAFPFLMRLMSLAPAGAFRLLAQSVTGRINLICTNVPGPPATRYLAGARIDALYPFAPVALGTPLSIALLSYVDTYCIGIDTDPAAIPDPKRLHRYLEDAVSEIERRVLPRALPARRSRPQRSRRVA